MQTEEQDEVELYLRTLRKKVEHQLKNPFQLVFSNYTFEELLNWKNNVLQLDATSRLYGQRVDFLHSGALHILGSVVNLEQQPHKDKQTKQEDHKEVSKQTAIENVFIKNLQNPEKLNGKVISSESNFLQWREIMKKRDTLPLLMLNQLPIATSLLLNLISQKRQLKVYEEIFKGEESIYLKMINFLLLQPGKCKIFQEIEETVSDIDSFLITMSNEKRQNPRDSFRLDSFMEFQFPLVSQSKKLGFVSNLKEDQIQIVELDDHEGCQQFNPEPVEGNNEQFQMGSCSSQTFSMFSMDTLTTQTIREKKVKKRKKSQRNVEHKKDEYIQFSGIYPDKNDILAIPEEKEELYLNHPDFLHLKFIKYQYPFSLKPKHKARRSLLRPSFHLNQNIPNNSHFETSDPQDPFAINSTLQLGKINTALSKRSQINIKQASLSLKMLKKKIREVKLDDSINLWEAKAVFSAQDPLDIYISILHIAAEDGLMIVK